MIRIRAPRALAQRYGLLVAMRPNTGFVACHQGGPGIEDEQNPDRRLPPRPRPRRLSGGVRTCGRGGGGGAASQESASASRHCPSPYESTPSASRMASSWASACSSTLHTNASSVCEPTVSSWPANDPERSVPTRVGSGSAARLSVMRRNSIPTSVLNGTAHNRSPSAWQILRTGGSSEMSFRGSNETILPSATNRGMWMAAGRVDAGGQGERDRLAAGHQVAGGCGQHPRGEHTGEERAS